MGGAAWLRGAVHLRRARVALGLVGCLAAGGLVAEDVCPPPESVQNGYSGYERTDAFALEAESAAGAVGDVVGVSITMRCTADVLLYPGMLLAIAYDPGVAEPVGNPTIPDELAGMASWVNTYPVNEGAGLPGDHRGHGFILDVNFNKFGFHEYFPSDVPLTLMTIWFRMKGAPGDTGLVRFADNELAIYVSRCVFNQLNSYGQDYPEVPYLNLLPGVTIPGTLTVLEGPATNTERPPEPPAAKVYPEKPSPEDVNFQVAISGGPVAPGDREVPVEVHVSADLEFSSISLPIDFDERYIRISRVEDHFLTGVALLDNEDSAPGAGPDEGHVIVFSGLGVNARRLAAEGERIHAATLYIDVLEAAAEIESTQLGVATVTDWRGLSYAPWIGVRYKGGTGVSDPPVRTEVEPISVVPGVLMMARPDSPFIRGDSDQDGELTVGDAIVTLGYLFLGTEELWCTDAADSNDDGVLNIGDPVALLDTLFLGGEDLPPPFTAPGQDPTFDELECFGPL